MPYVIKVSSHGNEVRRIFIPEIISIRYYWIKETSFVIYPYDKRFFCIKPIDDQPIKYIETAIDQPDIPQLFIKPLSRFKGFSFYLPPSFCKTYQLLHCKLMNVYDSGSPVIFLEAFPNGS